MPPRPPWHARAVAIRKDVERLLVPVLDRAMVEQLFGIERRTAQRLLGSLDGHVSAHTFVVPREAVLAMLDRLLAGKAAAAEAGRKQRLADALLALEQEALPRVTAIATVAVAESRTAWPAGVALAAPGVLRIQFTGADDLLGRILALTEQAAQDYPGFARSLAAANASGDRA